MTGTHASPLRRYLITDSRAGTPERMEAIVAAALCGGMTAVQLRARGWSDRTLFDAAQRLRRLTRQHGALFLVNDRVDVALACGADGVHLGVEDLPVESARRLLGPSATIGYSPDSRDDAVHAIAAGASYLGVGPVFPTSSKGDAGAPIGTQGISLMVDSVSVPVIGVGGIDPDNAGAVVAAGACGVAIVSAIFLADDPEQQARRLAAVVP